MKIKEYRKFLNSLPKEFDDYEITHREYLDTDGEFINAQEMGVYSVHIDEEQKLCCNMHKDSYERYREFVNLEKIGVPTGNIEKE